MSTLLSLYHHGPMVVMCRPSYTSLHRKHVQQELQAGFTATIAHGGTSTNLAWGIAALHLRISVPVSCNVMASKPEGK